MPASEAVSLPEPFDDNGVPIICPSLNHTGNATQRRREMLRWYKNVLGQQPTLEVEPPGAWFPATWTSNDTMHHRMGFVEIPEARGVNHTAWEYPDIDALLTTWERLTHLEIEPTLTVDHGITFAFYYDDPDGNVISLLCDAHGDHAKSLEYMLTSPEIRANPVGTPVDPAQLLEARRSGVGLEELHRRAYAGEFAPLAENTGQPTDETVVNHADDIHA